MGRGSMYNWPYFMLFDEDLFVFPACDPETGEVDESGPTEWDHEYFEYFKARAASAFKADRVDPERWIDRETYIFAETDRLELGIDWSGGMPCIFARPKTYEVLRFHGPKQVFVERDYQIDRVVQRAFNLLLSEFDFYFPSTPWTSYRLQRYSRWVG